MQFGNRNISQRLYWGFGSILLLLVLLCTLNIVVITRQGSIRKLGLLTQEAQQETLEANMHLANFLLSGAGTELTLMHENARNVGSKIDEAQRQTGDSELKAYLQASRAKASQWTEGFAKNLTEKRTQVDAGNATVAELQIYYLNLDPGQVIKDETEPMKQADVRAQKIIDDESTRALWLIIGLTAVAIVVGVLIAQRTAKSITDPTSQLIRVAAEIANSGDLDQTVDVSRQDEIGELARSFNNMVTYLREMAAVSEAMAGGDLTVEASARSSRDTLGTAFTEMSHGLRSLVKSVRDSASQVANGANEVASASDESAKINVQAASAIDEVTSTMHEMSINVQNMVKNTQTQASSVSETSASIDQMVASIQRVADTAKVLLDISQRSREEVTDGISTMEKATDGLTRINTAIQTSSTIIGNLGTRADDIGKIIEVIDDLAEQTNLLALNAAIEAARAGEHGLGFAVVADEVRKLAEKSAQSTREISELIQSIQKEARKAVENMERSTSIVNEGLTLGSDLNLALKKISNVVTEVYKFAQEIGAATNEQSHGSSQIARATTRLNEVTHEISSSVEEQASGAQAVVRAMEKMRELIQRSTSGSTELAASAEQMSKMARNLLDSMDRFVLESVGSMRHGGELPRPSARYAIAANNRN